MQVAKALGADVTAECSTANVELVRSIGADQVIDYTREDFSTTGALRSHPGYCGEPFVGSMQTRTHPQGTYVVIGNSGGRWLGGLRRLVKTRVLSPFVRQGMRSFEANGNKEDLLALKELIEAGKITPVIDRTYPLRDVPEAIRYLETGHARGKVVITI